MRCGIEKDGSSAMITPQIVNHPGEREETPGAAHRQQLAQLDLGEEHERCHLLWTSLEVLNAERVHARMGDAQFQAPLQCIHQLQFASTVNE
jgi:hypothetical protein